MGTSEKMFDWTKEWNISFAGCGFRSIYYVGALSCILERVPELVHGASKICGASSGCLVAAALAVGIPIEQVCVDILTTAKEARKHTLGVFHPTFSLLRTSRDFLLEKLPEDAHFRASGKLCVSLTRVADGKNVLVSQFASREELIQVLMCSCFFPVYCGFIPPTYHGVCYMDGALSNNMPLFEQRNTITMAPFSGESDICPREGTYNFFEVHYGNVSIQVNTGNVHRICTSFLPPRLEKLAEICHNGYMDALCFLRERNLLRAQCIPRCVVAKVGGAKLPCCDLMKEVTQAEEWRMKNEQNHFQEDHQWLDHKTIENLPVAIKKVLCKACRDSHDGGSWWPQFRNFLPAKLVMYLLIFVILPLGLNLSFTKSMIFLGCMAVGRLLTCRQTWSIRGGGINSRSFGSDSRNQRGDKNVQTLTSRITLKSKINLHKYNSDNMDLLPLISTSGVSPASCKVVLNTPINGHININKEEKPD